jgi:hypothetical protein
MIISKQLRSRDLPECEISKHHYRYHYHRNSAGKLEESIYRFIFQQATNVNHITTLMNPNPSLYQVTTQSPVVHLQYK